MVPVPDDWGAGLRRSAGRLKITYQCLSWQVTREWQPECGQWQVDANLWKYFQARQHMIQITKKTKTKRQKIETKTKKREKQTLAVSVQILLPLPSQELHYCPPPPSQLPLGRPRANLRVKYPPSEPTAGSFKLSKGPPWKQSARGHCGVCLQALLWEDLFLLPGRQQEEKEPTKKSGQRIRRRSRIE